MQMVEGQLSFQEGPNATEGPNIGLEEIWRRRPAGEAESHWSHLPARMLSSLGSDI